MVKNSLKALFQNKFLSFLLIVGTITWSVVMVKSGIVYNYGMGFWGPNGHDGIWHIALSESLARGSFQMPVFAGEALKNYHIGFDLLLALTHTITRVSISVLYFQIFPPVIALLVGILTYKLVLDWRKSELEANWAVFFVYFGGNFGWVITLLRGEGFGGESLFWSQQSISTLINPPFALSLVFLLLGLMNLKKRPYLSSLLFGLLIQIKAYSGFLILSGLFAASVWELAVEHKVQLIKVFILSFIISLVLFLPLNRNSQGLLVLQPFWFLETMMGLSDRLGWQKFGEAMVNYRSGGIYIKAVTAYLVAFLIFWFGNIGMRFVSGLFVFEKIKNIRKINRLEIILFVATAAGVVTPMFFLQKGTPWNTIQFFYYSLFFSGMFAGIAFGQVIKFNEKRYIKMLLTTLLVLFTLPTTLGTLKHYLPSRPPAKISNEELGALKFLSNQPFGNVLTFPYGVENIYNLTPEPPRPLYVYESTAYVAAFSKKDIYLEDQVNLNITNYDWQKRREEVLEFYETLDENMAFSFLRENNIKYVYWVKPQRAKLGETQLGLERIFENSEVDIYRVN